VIGYADLVALIPLETRAGTMLEARGIEPLDAAQFALAVVADADATDTDPGKAALVLKGIQLGILIAESRGREE
jgi:hypothetical protein